MSVTEFLIQNLGCRNVEYLGDGVYVGFDGFNIWLATERGSYIHHVALDGHTYMDFMNWTKRTPVYQSSEPTAQ